MTALVKHELARTACPNGSARKAEITALLRFSGGLYVVSDRVFIDAELDDEMVVRRLRRDIGQVYGYTSGISVVALGNRGTGIRYLLRVAQNGEALARRTGLVDQRGRPVRGLPPAIVAGGVADLEAVWRGAFLARGSLTGPGCVSLLEVICPGPEAAVALAGVARRLGLAAKTRELRGADQVILRDGDDISALLTRMGAHVAVIDWEKQRLRHRGHPDPNRMANFVDANLRRAEQAALAGTARVERALEVLGGDAPDHLLAAGRLRLKFRRASLEELGRRGDPPMTKDAIAGRLRRLSPQPTNAPRLSASPTPNPPPPTSDNPPPPTSERRRDPL